MGFCSSIPPKTWPLPNLTNHVCKIESAIWSRYFPHEDVKPAPMTREKKIVKFTILLF